MSDTWNKYCEKLEELRRLEDEARKRRKVMTESATVQVADKTISVSAGVARSIEGTPGGANEGNGNA